jgi:molybdopterin-guanine dinucleotide biosynthesis protein A
MIPTATPGAIPEAIPGAAPVAIPVANLGRVAGLVLAGGSARRMGGADKPLMDLAGRPLIAWVIAAMDLPDIAISANGDPGRLARFGRPVLEDGDLRGRGPLAGLLAGLEWAAARGAETLLTAPADTPFLPRGLAQALSPAPMAAARAGRHHHLVATWPVTCADALRAFLLSGQSGRVEQFANRIGVRYVEVMWQDPDPFFNINTVEDLRLARLRALQQA